MQLENIIRRGEGIGHTLGMMVFEKRKELTQFSSVPCTLVSLSLFRSFVH